MRIGRCVAIAATLIVLAGCSSSGGGSAPRTRSAITSEPPVLQQPKPGDDAATIASHIPRCTGVEAGDVGDGGPNLVSVATCTLTGHRMTVFTWSAPGLSTSPAQLAPGMTFTYGPRWTVTPPDDAPPATQRELAAAVVAALGGAVHVA